MKTDVHTIRQLMIVIESCERNLVLLHANAEMCFKEKQEKMDTLRHMRKAALADYYDLTAQFFVKEYSEEGVA